MAAESVDNQSVLAWNSEAACRTIDGTAFVLLRSRMVSLNSVGSFVWERFEKGAKVGEVVDAVVESFEIDRETALADTIEFIRTLKEKEMLVVAE